MTCIDCSAPIERKPGPGRPPVRCPSCARARNAARLRVWRHNHVNGTTLSEYRAAVSRTREEVEQAFDGDPTLQAAGQRLGVSRERARQLAIKLGIKRNDHRGLSQFEMAERWDSLDSSTRYRAAPRSRWPREGVPALKRRHHLCNKPGCHDPVHHAHTMCKPHLDEINDNTKVLHARRRAAGVCIRCEAPRIPNNANYCAPHAREASRSSSDAQKRVRARRRAAGLCITCGKPSYGYSRCADCRAKAKQRREIAVIGYHQG